MIEEIAERFAPKKRDRFVTFENGIESPPAPSECIECGSTEHWRAKGGHDWLCTRCIPIIDHTLVAERQGDDIRRLVDEYILPSSVPA